MLTRWRYFLPLFPALLSILPRPRRTLSLSRMSQYPSSHHPIDSSDPLAPPTHLSSSSSRPRWGWGSNNEFNKCVLQNAGVAIVKDALEVGGEEFDCEFLSPSLSSSLAPSPPSLFPLHTTWSVYCPAVETSIGASILISRGGVSALSGL